MENLHSSDENLTNFSPKAVIKKKRRPSVLSLRKHFRKLMKHDRVKYNKSISIIEISSSTDSGSFKSAITNINESEVSNPKNSRSNDNSDSDEIISPSPKKNSKNLICPVTKKKMEYNVRLCREEMAVKNECNLGKEFCMDFNPSSDVSILDYDKFRNPTNESYPLINSTMILSPETQLNILKSDVKDEFNSNTSVESVNKSCENLLDDIYGDSWRPYREKILPNSEKRPTKKKSVQKQIPATEKKPKKSEIHKNPYVEIEKHKSNNLLKALHTKRIREAIESPLIQNLKVLCDEESSEQSDAAQSSRPRIKLKFDQKTMPLECVDSENLKKKIQPNSNDDFCWSDKENSLGTLPLKDRILRKKLAKHKNMHNLEKNQVEKDRNESKYNKKTSLSDEDKHMILSKTSSSGVSSESGNEDKRQNTCKVNKKKQTSQMNHKNCLETSLSFLANLNISDDNVAVKKGRVCMKNLKKYLDSSSDETESNKKVTAPETYHSKFEDSIENTVKKITKKIPNQKIATNSNGDHKKISNHQEADDKKIRKEVLRLRTQNKKNFTENSSDSDDSLVNSNKEIELKNTDKNKTYSFLASLSSNVPDHKCDPTAKIFKVNFKNNKENLAKKLFELYNENVFDNLIPKTVPLEWNARLLATAGYCNSKRVTHRDGKIDMEARIVLSNKVLTTPDRLRDTLIHEMCHAATWLIDKVRDGHGQYWKAWAEKAKKVYPELPPIKTCHNYELSSKYVYKCTGCGYEVKRHRKSLDIERKRCGYCCGKFEIFLNKVSGKGEPIMVPLVDTPKKEPKGFAAFYQENYAKYKSPRTTPAEVMKLLSKKFKEMKVQ